MKKSSKGDIMKKTISLIPEDIFERSVTDLRTLSGSKSKFKRQTALDELNAYINSGGKPEDNKRKALARIDGAINYIIHDLFHNTAGQSFIEKTTKDWGKSLKEFFHLKGTDPSILKKLLRAKIYVQGFNSLKDIIQIYKETEDSELRTAIKSVVFDDPIASGLYQTDGDMQEMAEYNAKELIPKKQVAFIKSKNKLSQKEKQALAVVFRYMDANQYDKLLPFIYIQDTQKFPSDTSYANRYSDVLGEIDAIRRVKTEYEERNDVYPFLKLQEVLMDGLFSESPFRMDGKADVAQTVLTQALFNYSNNTQSAGYADMFQKFVSKQSNTDVESMLTRFKIMDTKDRPFEEVLNALKGKNLLAADGVTQKPNPRDAVCSLFDALTGDRKIIATSSRQDAKRQLSKKIIDLPYLGVFDDCFRKFSAKPLTQDMIQKCRAKIFRGSSAYSGSIDYATDGTELVSKFDKLVDIYFDTTLTAAELMQIPVSKQEAFLQKKKMDAVKAAYESIINEGGLAKKILEVFGNPGDKGEDLSVANTAWLGGDWTREAYAKGIIAIAKQGSRPEELRINCCLAVLQKRGLMPVAIYKDAVDALIAMTGKGADVKKKDALASVLFSDANYEHLSTDIRTLVADAYIAIADKSDAIKLANILRNAVPESDSLSANGKLVLKGFGAAVKIVAESGDADAQLILTLPGNSIKMDPELMAKALSAPKNSRAYFESFIAKYSQLLPVSKTYESADEKEKFGHDGEVDDFMTQTSVFLKLLETSKDVTLMQKEGVNPEEILQKAERYAQTFRIKIARKLVRDVFSLLGVPEAKRLELLTKLEPAQKVATPNEIAKINDNQIKALDEIDKLLGTLGKQVDDRSKLGNLADLKRKFKEITKLDNRIALTMIQYYAASSTGSLGDDRMGYVVDRVLNPDRQNADFDWDATLKPAASQLLVSKAAVATDATVRGLLAVLRQPTVPEIKLYKDATKKLISFGKKKALFEMLSADMANNYKKYNIKALEGIANALIDSRDGTISEYIALIIAIRSKIGSTDGYDMNTGDDFLRKTEGDLKSLLLAAITVDPDKIKDILSGQDPELTRQLPLIGAELIGTLASTYVSKYSGDVKKLNDAVLGWNLQSREAYSNAIKSIMKNLNGPTIVNNLWDKILSASSLDTIKVQGLMDAILSTADQSIWNYHHILSEALQIDGLDLTTYSQIVDKLCELYGGSAMQFVQGLMPQSASTTPEASPKMKYAPSALQYIAKKIIDEEGRQGSQSAEGCYWIVQHCIARQPQRPSIAGRSVVPQTKIKPDDAYAFDLTQAQFAFKIAIERAQLMGQYMPGNHYAELMQIARQYPDIFQMGGIAGRYGAGLGFPMRTGGLYGGSPSSVRSALPGSGYGVSGVSPQNISARMGVYSNPSSSAPIPPEQAQQDLAYAEQSGNQLLSNRIRFAMNKWGY